MNELFEKPPLDCWGTLEAMGHQSHTGHITEERFGAASLFRVDCPALDATTDHDCVPAYSKLYGAGSIYCITPMEESLVMQLLHKRAAQVQAYRAPHRIALPRPDEDEEDDPEDPREW